MFGLLFSVPLFIVISVLQSVAISRITILSGFADLILLVMVSMIVLDEDGNFVLWAIIAGFLLSLLSALPALVEIVIYLGVAMTAKFLDRLFWQSPMITLFSATFIGTLIKLLVELVFLQTSGISLPLIDSIASVFLPCLVLNLFFIFPVFSLMGDLARLISPGKESYAE